MLDADLVCYDAKRPQQGQAMNGRPLPKGASRDDGPNTTKNEDDAILDTAAYTPILALRLSVNIYPGTRSSMLTIKHGKRLPKSLPATINFMPIVASE